MTVSEFINKVGFKVDEQSVNKVNGTISNIKSSATKMLGFLGIAFSAKEIIKISEEFNDINDKIAYAAEYADNLKDIQKDILDAANRSKVAYGDMAATVTALKQANGDVFPLEDATQFVEVITKLGKAAGLSDGEISGMQSTMKRVAASGEMTSQIINRAARTTPVLIEQLCKSLGVTKDQLVAMADAGELSADRVKKALLSSKGDIDAAFDNLDYSISDALLNIRNKWGFWVDDINSALGLTQTIAKVMTKGFDQVINVLTKFRNGVMWVSEKLGGTENLLKTIAIVGGTLLVAMKAEKIIDFLTKAFNGVKSIFTAMSTLSLKAKILIGIIIVLALIIDDIINFVKGNDSVLGELFKRAGIDAEDMRQKIINIWNNLKKFFKGIWESIKGIVTPILDKIKDKLGKTFGGDSFANLGEGIAGVINFLDKLMDSLAKNKGAQDTIAKIALAITSVVTALVATKKVTGVVSNVLTAFQGFSKLSKVGSFVKGFAGKFSGLKKVFSGFSPKIMIIIAVIAALVDIFALLGKNSDQVKEKIQGFVDGMTEKINSFVSKLPEFLNAGIELVNKIVEGIVQNAPAIIEGLSSALTAGISAISSMLPQILEMGIQLLMSLIDGILSVLPTLIQAAIQLISTIVQAILSNLPTIIQMGIQLLTTLINGILQALPQLIQAAITLITTIVQALVDNLPVILQMGLELLMSLIQGILDNLPEIINTVLMLIETLVNALLENLPLILDMGIQLLMALINGIIQSLPQIISAILTLIQTIVSTLISNLPQLLQMGIQLITSLISGIGSVIGNVKSSIVQGIQPAIDWIKNLPKQALQWGSDIISNIANGIKNAIGKVKDAASNVASAIKSVLHFSEPDEGPLSDFHTYMPDMMSGLAQGMEKGRDKVKKAVGNVAGDIAALSGAGNVSGNTASFVSGGGSASRTIVQNIEINNAFNGDKAIQREASNTMKNSADDITAELSRALSYVK